MEQLKTLEILIPTFGRPASAAQAIESCLANPDPRLYVRCNSNGYEPSLEKFKDYDSRLTYSCFDSNKGPHANFLYLLQTTKARFCMLLSDEDRIESSAVTKFLDFLDSCPESVKVVTCSIYDTINDRFYFLPDHRIAHKDIDFNAAMALSIIPTYMSGLVFSVADLAKLNLFELFKPSLGNAYSHLEVSKHLLVNGFLRIYTYYFVLKGKEIHEGGDGYSHRKSRQVRVLENLDLNPLIYGPKARARQFYYSDNRFSSLRRSMGIVSYFIAKLNLFSTFMGSVLSSNTVTIINKSVRISGEVKLALSEAKQFNEYSGSAFAFMFYYFIKLPILFNRILLKFLSKILGLLRRIMTLVVIADCKVLKCIKWKPIAHRDLL